MVFKQYVLIIMAFLGMSNNTMPHAYTQSNITIARGDITKTSCQCIVNAANEQLAGGGGVCGAIFTAAGWDKLQQACDQAGFCKTGQAKITKSFDLTTQGIEYIIHAVGPDCRIVKDQKTQDVLLQNAYVNSLKLANEYQIKSIAFPFISSAIYAFPKMRAAMIALQAVQEHVQQTSLEKVEFVLYSQEDYDLFCQIQQLLINV